MASGSFNLTRTGSTSTYVTFKCSWSSEADTAKNQSTVTVKVTATKSSASTSATWGSQTTTAKVNGTSKSNSGSFTLNAGSTITLLNTTYTVPHNADGTKTTTISVSVGGDVMYGNGSKSVTLDEIPRKATVTSAPNFDDEDNPTMKYENKAGNAVDSLSVCISLDGSKADIPYREVEKTSTSYTFNLTTTERNTLINSIKTGSSRTVKFYVKTKLNGVDYFSSVSKTFSLVNHTPVISPEVVDVNETTVALTGNKALVKGVSKAQFTIGAEARKNATITGVQVVNGSKTVKTNSGIINNVDSGTFVFKATDSRSNTTSKTITKELINYMKPTCNLVVTTPTLDGVSKLQINGNFFAGSFGAVENTITLQYRYKKANEEYGDWVNIQANVNVSAYTANVDVSITNFDYRSGYTFQARVVDALNDILSTEYDVIAIPVFDWGKNDFAFNVPVRANGGFEAYNPDNDTYGLISALDLVGFINSMQYAYPLTTSTTAGTNWTVKSFSSTLVNGQLRCMFNFSRSSASASGNITNELVAKVEIEHNGKLKTVYSNGIVSSGTGGVAIYQINNIVSTDNTISFDLYLAATGSAITDSAGYFSLPAMINPKGFVE